MGDCLGTGQGKSREDSGFRSETLHTLTHTLTLTLTHSLTEDESEGEEEGGGLGENVLSGLRARLRELSSSSDVISKTRCV